MTPDTQLPAAIQIPELAAPAGVLGGGAVAGLCAGVAMLAVAVACSRLASFGFGYPLRLVGAAWLGRKALYGGTGTCLVGCGMHLLVSAALGIPFAALSRGSLRLPRAIPLGWLYSLVAWACATFVALPLIDPIMGVRVLFHPGFWFLLHMVFGTVLGLTPAIQRALFAPASDQGAEPIDQDVSPAA